MSETGFEAIIHEHAAPLAADLGLELWGIELIGANNPIVRIYVERSARGDQDPGPEGTPGGVDIEHCAELSRRLGLTLEVEEVFAGAWTLEVSSPGFERPFFAVAQLPPYIGREVELTLSGPLAEWPGRKKFRGVLRAVLAETVALALDDTQRRPSEPEEVTVPWSHVRKARLIHIFEEPEKPGKSKKTKATKTTGAAEPSA